MKEEKLSCKHWKKEGHDDENCWQLHPEKKPKWFKERKGRQKVATGTRPTYCDVLFPRVGYSVSINTKIDQWWFFPPEIHKTTRGLISSSRTILT